MTNLSLSDKHLEIFLAQLRDISSKIGIAHQISLNNIYYTEKANNMLYKLIDHPTYSTYLHPNIREFPIGINIVIQPFSQSKSITELIFDNNTRYITVSIHLQQSVCSDINIDPNPKQIFEKDVIPDWERSAHGNIIIIDKERKEIERFEPHGTNDVLVDSIDDRLKDILFHLIPNFSTYSYFKPSDYYEQGPQTIEYSSSLRKQNNLIGGFCGWWCLFYLYSRLIYEIEREIVITRLSIDKDELFSLIWWFREKLLIEDYTSIKQKLVELYL